MPKGMIAAVIAVLLSVLPSPAGDLSAAGRPEEAEIPAGVCRCLAVGMDEFVTEETTAPCSANNAETMAALLADFLPEGTRVARRVNGPGSAAELEEVLFEAFGEATEEDVSLLYVSTHGAAWEDGGEIRAGLVISDGAREEILDPGTLRAWMDRIPGRKVLILDCCHAGAVAESFRAPEWRVIAGCAAEEESWFWAAGEATGMGYFTAALESALRASARERIDPDGDGAVSLAELERRIREIYGVSEAVFLPSGDGSALFTLPGARAAAERILDLRFDPPETEDGQVTLSFHFRTETAVRMEYRLVPGDGDGWDFSGAARLADTERAGRRRGTLSPGEKDRTVRVSAERLGERGKALLQIVSFRGVYGQVPVVEGTAVIRADGPGDGSARDEEETNGED